MRKRIATIGAAGLVAAVAALTLGAPASAGDTTVDVVVDAGSLSISAQPASATLTGADFNANNPTNATGSFGQIEVTDGRGLALPWSLTASSTNFTGLSDGTKSIALSPTSPLTFQTTTVTVGPTPADGAGLAAGGALTAAATAVSIATGTNAVTAIGDVTYSWTPNVTLVVPANTPAQTYRGTVTLAVA